MVSFWNDFFSMSLVTNYFVLCAENSETEYYDWVADLQ